jgi:protein-glutamine gamma-glutamyltransferase
LSEYLQNTYPYDLNIPPFPDNRDSIDYFLFEEKRGYCEHFASALVIMLRTVGIPARMVFGYQPGDYNPISGYYSVKQSDAHAWTEVYISGYGWYAVDPTPGSDGATYSATRNQSRWLFLSLLEWLLDRFSATRIPTGIILFFVFGTGLIYISLQMMYSYHKFVKIQPEKSDRFINWASLRVKKALLEFKDKYILHEKRTPDHQAVRIYKEMLKEFERKGFVKCQSSTAREFTDGTIPVVFAGDTGRIVSIYESVRYGAKIISDNELEEIHLLWLSLQKKIRKYRKKADDNNDRKYQQTGK